MTIQIEFPIHGGEYFTPDSTICENVIVIVDRIMKYPDGWRTQKTIYDLMLSGF
jgi:hypothetical protein